MNIYIPLSPDALECCEMMDCEEDAKWRCHPQGYLHINIFLCSTHKQQAEQEEDAREDL
jgi:hypothetical protein